MQYPYLNKAKEKHKLTQTTIHLSCSSTQERTHCAYVPLF